MFCYIEGLRKSNSGFKKNLSCLESFLPSYFETNDTSTDVRSQPDGECKDKINVGKQILHISSSSLQVTAIKIYQSLKPYLTNRDDKSILFGPLSALLLCERKLNNMRNCVTSAFDSLMDVLIIAEDVKNYSDAFTEKLWAILKAKRNKKLIILSETSVVQQLMDSSLIEDLILTENDYFEDQYQKINDSPDFSQLSIESQKCLLKKKVAFQGQEMELCELIYGEKLSVDLINSFLSNLPRCEDDFNTLLCGSDSSDTKILEILISETNLLEIGQICEPFSDDETHCYIDRDIMVRTFSPYALYKCHNDGCIYLVEGSSVEQAQQYLNSKRIPFQDLESMNECSSVAVLNPKIAFKEYRKIIEQNQKYFYPIYYLKLFNELLFLYDCNELGQLNINRLVKNNFVKVIDIPESQWLNLYLPNRSVLIVDEAGSGKSIFCNTMLKKLYMTEPCGWKLRINLIQHNDTLQKCVFDLTNDSQLSVVNVEQKVKEELLRTLKLLSNYNSMLQFERRLFEHKFNNNMVLIFDGYDEICPHYGGIVSDILLQLINYTENKVIVTSKPETKERLEIICGAVSNKMADVTNPKQKKMLSIFLTKYGNYVEENKITLVNEYANILLGKLNKVIYAGKPIGCNPLYLKLIAEIFTENCLNYVTNNGAMHMTDYVQNLLDLYNQFVEKIIKKRFFKEKEKFSSSPYMEESKEILYIREIKIHQLLAMKVLNEEAYGLLENNDFNSPLIDMFKKIDRFGLARFNNGNPLFLHSTFAEYFAACYLSEQLILKPEKVDNILAAIDNILAQDVKVYRQCLRILLDQIQPKLISGLRGTSFTNLSAKKGLLRCIFYFKDKVDFPCRDENGNSPLDYAVEHGNVKVMSIVSILINKINVKNLEEIKQSFMYDSIGKRFYFESLLISENILIVPAMIYDSLAALEFILNSIKMNYEVKYQPFFNLEITTPASEKNGTRIIKIIKGPEYELTLLQAIIGWFETQNRIQNAKNNLCYAVNDNYQISNPDNQVKLKKLGNDDLDVFIKDITTEQYRIKMSSDFLIGATEEKKQFVRALTIILVRYPLLE